MSEAEVVLKSKKPYTKKDLIADFKRIGLQEGDTVLVHSSLSAIGWVAGKEIAVIEALLESVGKSGTILMPAQSGDWTDPVYWENPPVPKEWISVIREEMIPFDPLTTPTRGMGRVADAFWRYPGSIRSDHPHVSFSGNGLKAKDILENHPLSYGLGIDSPLGKLYHLHGKILLLGVGYGNCTSLHLCECLQDHPKLEKQGARMKEGWIEFEDVSYDDEDFEILGADYEKEHTIRSGLIGQAEGKLIDMHDLVDFGTIWMSNHRTE